MEFSPELEHLWGHQLQRVRRSVKVDHVELHRWVGLACLGEQHNSPEFRRKEAFQYIVYVHHGEKYVLKPLFDEELMNLIFAEKYHHAEKNITMSVSDWFFCENGRVFLVPLSDLTKLFFTLCHGLFD